MPHVSDQKIIEAVTKSRGLISVAAKSLGISRRTIHNRAAKSKAIREAIEEARDLTTDIAEAALYKAIENGEGWAVCFYLKCIGKERGYVERQEVTGRNGGPIETKDVTDLSDAELTTRAKALVNRLAVAGVNGNGNGNGNGRGG